MTPEQKPEIVVCTVGMLLGDSWTTIPAVRDLCKEHTVNLVCGSYAEPAWRWAADNIVGCDWKIVRVVLDPDDYRSAFCPGFGVKGLDPALRFVRDEMPESKVLGYNEIGSYYSYTPPEHDWHLDLRRAGPGGDGRTVIHPYTAHNWKNCDGIVSRAAYRRSVLSVGLPLEKNGTESSYSSDFNEICASILSCAGFVGILSSWSNFAAIFRVPQIVVSFTQDVPLKFNPYARVLVTPTLQELQAEIERMGL